MQLFKPLLIGLLLFWASSADAQIMLMEDSSLNLTPGEVLERFRSQQNQSLLNSKANIGFTTSVYWLWIHPKQVDQEYRLIIGNAHINQIEFYQINAHTESYELRYLTGDHFPFAQRPLKHPLFVFPINYQDSAHSYLVKIDKRNESLQLSAHLVLADDYYTKTQTDTFINGALTGILVLILLLAIFLFGLSGNRLYFYYLLYISLAWLWIFADKGYGYQYLWPNWPDFASRARPFFYALSCAGLLLFMRVFINQAKQSRLYKWGTVTILLFIALAVLSLWFDYSADDGKLLLLLLLVVTPSGLLAILVIVLSLAQQIRAGQMMAWYYLGSVSVFLLFSVFEILAHSGFNLLSSYYLSNFGIHTGLLMEAIILFYGLAHQFNKDRKEKEQLLITINQQQEVLTTKIMETQERERKKIADQLHDEVGSLLSVVNLNISSVLEHQQYLSSAEQKLHAAQETLLSASGLVRNLSHTLTPIAIEKYGFRRAIENLCDTINIAGKLHVECQIIGFEAPYNHSETLLFDLYRCLQELLNNIIKHSGAHHAFVELVEHDDLITVIVEDQGQGMPEHKIKGQGLENLVHKIRFYQGTMEINSRLNKGTLIAIEIPFTKED